MNKRFGVKTPECQFDLGDARLLALGTASGAATGADPAERPSGNLRDPGTGGDPMKNLLHAFGMILGGALLLVIVLPYEVIQEAIWRCQNKGK